MDRTRNASAVAIGLAIGLVGAARAYGQAPAGHAHTAPHGGEVVEVANHHVEFKADSSGAIYVWLLDARQKPVAAPAGAAVTLVGSGGAQVTLPLQAQSASQQLVARFDPQKFARFQAVVSITIAGTRHNLRFRYPGHR